MTWDKLKPAGGLPLSVGDDRIRENFDHLEDALAREHQFPTAYGLSSGRHIIPIESTFADLGLIAGPVDGMIAGRDDLKALYQRQAATFEGMIGVTVGTRADRVGFATADLPGGYAWIESDIPGEPLWYWSGTAWVRTGAQPGLIVIWPLNNQPTGWLKCNGQSVDGTDPDFTDLWDVIDLDYGGTGQADFLVPDIRTRAIFGFKSGDANHGTMGQHAGALQHEHGAAFESDVPTLLKGAETTPWDVMVASQYHKHDVDVPLDDHLPLAITLQFLIKI